MLRKLVLVASAVLCLVAVNLRADEVLLEQFYGEGVHAYNQGDYIGAYNSLSSAIKGGTNDPRAYYFRGLAYLKLGRDPEAKADFQAGAELEVGDSADVYPVNRSLERVQGSSRQVLEQYRTSVHAAAVQRREAERQVRYEQRAAAEQDVLRRVSPRSCHPTLPDKLLTAWIVALKHPSPSRATIRLAMMRLSRRKNLPMPNRHNLRPTSRLQATTILLASRLPKKEPFRRQPQHPVMIRLAPHNLLPRLQRLRPAQCLLRQNTTIMARFNPLPAD